MIKFAWEIVVIGYFVIVVGVWAFGLGMATQAGCPENSPSLAAIAVVLPAAAYIGYINSDDVPPKSPCE